MWQQAIPYLMENMFVLLELFLMFLEDFQNNQVEFPRFCLLGLSMSDWFGGDILTGGVFLLP